MKTDENALARAANLTDDQLTGLDLGPAPRPMPRRRKRLVAAGVGLAVAVAVGAPAAAGVFGARTGIFGHGGEDGHSERLRLDAPDIGDIYRTYTDRQPLPPGRTWDEFLDRQAGPGVEAGFAPEEVVAQWVAWEARCEWDEAYLAGEPTAPAELSALLARMSTQFAANDAGGLGAQLNAEITAEIEAGKTALVERDRKANCG